jgi:hypothetical protein
MKTTCICYNNPLPFGVNRDRSFAAEPDAKSALTQKPT